MKQDMLSMGPELLVSDESYKLFRQQVLEVLEKSISTVGLTYMDSEHIKGDFKLISEIPLMCNM